VEPAEMVDLAEGPADAQWPGDRSAGREPEQDIDDILLADQDCEREVGQGRVRQVLQRRATGRRPPASGAERVRQQPEIHSEDKGNQPVVMAQRGPLPDAPQEVYRRRLAISTQIILVGGLVARPRLKSRVTHAVAARSAPGTLTAVSSSAALSIFPRLVTGSSGSAYTAAGTQ